ncbi:MAG: DNA primase [Elusimicrobiales bacterium]
MDYSKIVKEVKERVDIVDIVSFYVKDLKKRGKNYVALCPFHSERTPSFTVTREKQIYYCFGCGAGGDVISFVSKIENISRFQALKKIALMSGINIDIKESWEESELDKEKKLIKQINLEAAALYSSILKSSEGRKAISFLREKGIKDETITNFMLGYAPPDEKFLYSKLSKKYSKDILMKTSLFSLSFGNPCDIFRDRLVIPIRSIGGEIIGFGARALSGENPKYLNSSENSVFSKRKTLFGLFNALSWLRKEKKVILVEGYFDVMLMHQYMFTITVSTMGTSFTKEHAHMLRNYVDEIIFMFDSDNAGINAAIKASEIALEEGLYPKVVLLDKNTDPDEYLLKNGTDSMIDVIKSACDIVSFKINLIKKNNPELSPDMKLKAAEFVCQTISKERNEIIRMEWIKKTSQSLDIDESSIKKLLELKNSNQFSSFRLNPSDIPVIEENLVEMIFKKPSLIEIIPQDFDLSCISSQTVKKILLYIKNEKLMDCIEETLIKKFPEHGSEILKISLKSTNLSEEAINEENFKKTLKIIEKMYLERELKKLTSKPDMSDDELKKYNQIMIKLANIKI